MRLYVNISILGAIAIIIAQTSTISFDARIRSRPSRLVLFHSGKVLKTDGPVRSLLNSSHERKTVFIVDEATGDVSSYSETESNRRFHKVGETSGTAALGANGQVACVGADSRIWMSSRTEKPIGSVPYGEASSMGLLSNGNLVVAFPRGKTFLHLFNPTGALLKSFGTVKDYGFTSAQNRFLHKGKIVVDSKDNIYVAFYYLPLVLKFSPTGTLLSEINVEGAAVDSQREVANRFYQTKNRETVGGIGILNSATVDPETDHLWISLNGSSITGVVYEYGPDGEKLNEYALEFDVGLGSSRIISPQDIAILSSTLYVLTSEHSVIEFNRREAYSRSLNDSEVFSNAGFIHNKVLAEPVCGDPQGWPGCEFLCPSPVCSGGQPTATSSDSSTQNCHDNLASSIGADMVSSSAPVVMQLPLGPKTI